MNKLIGILCLVFCLYGNAQEVMPVELETSIPTVLRITVVDWNSGTSKTQRGCSLGYMTQLSSANTTYLFATCSLSPVVNKMPTYFELNQFSTVFVEIGINNPGLNELVRLHLQLLQSTYSFYFDGCVEVFSTRSGARWAGGGKVSKLNELNK